jgi:DNA-binding PadR family transcriptional regulator
MKKPAVLKGTVDLITLHVVGCAPMHGRQLVSILQGFSSGLQAVETSAVYQSLYRLRDQGLLVSKSIVTANNRQASLYEITPAGRSHLTRERRAWQAFVQDVQAILDTRFQAPSA